VATFGDSGFFSGCFLLLIGMPSSRRIRNLSRKQSDDRIPVVAVPFFLADLVSFWLHEMSRWLLYE